MDELIKRIVDFRDRRDWKQFHTPENLAKSISIEAAELLENFQWNNDFDKTSVEDELADIMSYCILMSDILGVDIVEIMNRKIDKNEEKYPADLVKGSSKKYNEYKIEDRMTRKKS